MEYKKKKKGIYRPRHNRFALLAVVLILVLLLGVVLLSNMVIKQQRVHPFDRTATAIVVTNEHAMTLISQTQAAATEQYSMTGTTRP